jgi:hypothetical protein
MVDTSGEIGLLAPSDVHYREQLGLLDTTTFCYQTDTSRMHREVCFTHEIALEQFPISALDQEATIACRITVTPNPIRMRQVIPRQMRQIVMHEMVVIVQIQKPHQQPCFVDDRAVLGIASRAMLVQRSNHRQRKRRPCHPQQVIPPRYARIELQPRKQHRDAAWMTHVNA